MLADNDECWRIRIGIFPLKNVPIPHSQNTLLAIKMYIWNIVHEVPKVK